MRRQAGGAQAGGYGRPVPTASAGDSAEAGRVSRPTSRNWGWAHPTGAYEVETKILKQPIPGGNGARPGWPWAKPGRRHQGPRVAFPRPSVFVGCGAGYAECDADLTRFWIDLIS